MSVYGMFLRSYKADTSEEHGDCSSCVGTGMGQYEDSNCFHCCGTGIEGEAARRKEAYQEFLYEYADHRRQLEKDGELY